MEAEQQLAQPQRKCSLINLDKLADVSIILRNLIKIDTQERLDTSAAKIRDYETKKQEVNQRIARLKNDIARDRIIAERDAQGGTSRVAMEMESASIHQARLQRSLTVDQNQSLDEKIAAIREQHRRRTSAIARLAAGICDEESLDSSSSGIGGGESTPETDDFSTIDSDDSSPDRTAVVSVASTIGGAALQFQRENAAIVASTTDGAAVMIESENIEAGGEMVTVSDAFIHSMLPLEEHAQMLSLLPNVEGSALNIAAPEVPTESTSNDFSIHNKHAVYNIALHAITRLTDNQPSFSASKGSFKAVKQLDVDTAGGLTSGQSSSSNSPAGPIVLVLEALDEADLNAPALPKQESPSLIPKLIQQPSKPSKCSPLDVAECERQPKVLQLASPKLLEEPKENQTPAPILIQKKRPDPKPSTPSEAAAPPKKGIQLRRNGSLRDPAPKKDPPKSAVKKEPFGVTLKKVDRRASKPDVADELPNISLELINRNPKFVRACCGHLAKTSEE